MRDRCRPALGMWGHWAVFKRLVVSLPFLRPLIRVKRCSILVMSLLEGEVRFYFVRKGALGVESGLGNN